MSNEKICQQHEAVMAADVICDAVALIQSGRPALALESLAWALHLLPDTGRPEQAGVIAPRKKRAGFGK